MHHRKSGRYGVTEEVEDRENKMLYIKKQKIFITIVLVCSVLYTGCGYTPVIEDTETVQLSANKTVSFAEQIVGIYKTHFDESGETVMQIYLLGDRMIAEAEEEYAAYYAMEWMPAEPKNTDGDPSSEQFVVYTFSGFSNFGEYWNTVRQITVNKTDTGIEMIDENGVVTAYIRDDTAEPIHTTEQCRSFLSAICDETNDITLHGQWQAVTEDGYTLFLQLDTDGEMIWYCKKESEPIEFHIGVAAQNSEAGTIRTVSERVGWAQIPWRCDFRYTCGSSGQLILENAEADGLLPNDSPIEFIKNTYKE